VHVATVRLQVVAAAAAAAPIGGDVKVGQCKVDVFETCVAIAWFQHLNLKFAEPLSNFAFNFHLRCYIKVMIRANNQPAGDTPAAISAGAGLVGLNGYDGAATTRRHLLTLPGRGVKGDQHSIDVVFRRTESAHRYDHSP